MDEPCGGVESKSGEIGGKAYGFSGTWRSPLIPGSYQRFGTIMYVHSREKGGLF